MNLDNLTIEQLAQAGGCEIEQYFVIFLPCQKLKSQPKEHGQELGKNVLDELMIENSKTQALGIARLAGSGVNNG